MIELREVPENARRCKVCGWIIIPTKTDEDCDKCFCCRNGIPLNFEEPNAPPAQ